MKHLRNQLFICEKDITIGDKSFKQGACYASSSVCNDYVNMVLDGEFVALHYVDLIVHFKLINSPVVLDCLLKSIKSIKQNPHIDSVTNEYLINSLLKDAGVYINAFKGVAT